MKPGSDVIGVYCDATKHWKRTRRVGTLSREESGEWVRLIGGTLTMELVQVDLQSGQDSGEVRQDDGVVGRFVRFDQRRRFRLWCDWCGVNSVVVVRGERLDPLLDRLRDIPGRDITLGWLAAKVLSTGK